MFDFIPTRCGFRIVSACLIFLASMGCDGGPKNVPVAGTVTVNGQPLAQGSLSFKPDAAKGNESKHESAGIIEAGEYTLYTDGKPGAPLGWYKVVIVSQPEVDSTKAGQPKSLLAPVFSNPEKTPLSVEVVGSPTEGAYDFRISK